MTEAEKAAEEHVKNTIPGPPMNRRDEVDIIISKGDFLAGWAAGVSYSEKWVPVNERLPVWSTEQKKRFYQASDGKDIFKCFYTKGDDVESWNDDEPRFLEPGFYEELEQHQSEFDFCYFKREVTHWRELPTPPKTTE
jgi:hypothetical protein